MSQSSLRSKCQIWLLRNRLEQLPSNRVPTKREVLRYFFFLKEGPMKHDRYSIINTVICSKKTDELCSIWEKTGIKTQRKDKVKQKNVTLLTAEGIFKFLINKLNQKKFSFCIRMKDAVLKRFTEGRQSNLVSLYKYLSNPDCLHEIEEHKILNMPSKTVLQKTAKLCFQGFSPQKTLKSWIK